MSHLNLSVALMWRSMQQTNNTAAGLLNLLASALGRSALSASLYLTTAAACLH